MLQDTRWGTSVEERIKNAVKGKTPQDRLDVVLQVISMGLEAEVRLRDLTADAWELVLREEWWRARYKSLEDFTKHSGMSDSMAEVIRRRKRTATKKRRFRSLAVKHWGGEGDLETILGLELMPQTASKRFLEVTKVLARRLPDASEAVELLTAARDERLRQGRKSKVRNLLIQDIKMALATLDGREEKRKKTIQGAALESEMAESELESVSESESEPSDEEVREKPCRCGDRQSTERIVEAMDECDRKDLRGKVEALELDAEGWRRICYRHVKIMASKLELQTSRLDWERLIERMMAVQANVERLNELVTGEATYKWFRLKGRPKHPDDDLGPFKYQRLEEMEFKFDKNAVWERYAGAGAMEKFLEEGNVVVRGVFDWIVRDSELMGMVDMEFDMYRHHLREQNDVPNYGWCRNMWHSLTQQAIRQDPVFYALNVVARPDLNWRLVSFPDYTKYTTEGDSTGFKHIDINIPKLLKSGRGANIVQTAISMDDEFEDGCTIVVPKFHRHIGEWWEKVKSRGQATNGMGHSVEDTYLTEDEDQYGEFRPVVCKQGDVRMTMAAMIHGSTRKCPRRRRVVFPWLVGVDSDHQMLDVKESGSWEDICRAHRKMCAMRVGATGQSHKFNVGNGRFVGSIEMRGISAIGDALVGVREWNSWAVSRERNIILGPDGDQAWKYVEDIRRRMKERWKECFKELVSAEACEYGDKAYFNSMEGLCSLALNSM